MAVLTRSVLSTDYVRVPADAMLNGQYVDLTQDVVDLAFPATGVAPASGDWKTGIWQTTTVVGKYLGCLLVGPAGSFSLAVGTYDIWIRIHNTPALPASLRGQLVIE